MALLSGISEAKILEVKQTEIHEKASQSIKSKGWLPGLFRSIVNKAKDFLQNLIREHDMPPKPVLEIPMCMGFGCNAAGITGCRIIDSPRERLVAILTNNFVPYHQPLQREPADHEGGGGRPGGAELLR